MDDFKKFCNTAGTALNRAVQKTEETFGHAEKTEYDAHVENLMLRCDQTQQWTEKIIAATEAMLQPNPAFRVEDMMYNKLDAKKKERNNVAEELGDTMISAGQELGPSFPYGNALILCGQTEQKIGQAQREFVIHVNGTYLQPLRNFLENEMKTIQKERKTLENLRLDLDSHKNKVKRIKADAAKKAAEEELLKAEQEFNRQLELTQKLLEDVRSTHTQHKKHLNELVEAQMNFYAQCHQHMQELNKQLENSSL